MGVHDFHSLVYFAGIYNTEACIILTVMHLSNVFYFRLLSCNKQQIYNQ